MAGRISRFIWRSRARHQQRQIERQGQYVDYDAAQRPYIAAPVTTTTTRTQTTDEREPRRRRGPLLLILGLIAAVILLLLTLRFCSSSSTFIITGPADIQRLTCPQVQEIVSAQQAIEENERLLNEQRNTAESQAKAQAGFTVLNRWGINNPNDMENLNSALEQRLASDECDGDGNAGGTATPTTPGTTASPTATPSPTNDADNTTGSGTTDGPASGNGDNSGNGDSGGSSGSGTTTDDGEVCTSLLPAPEEDSFLGGNGDDVVTWDDMVEKSHNDDPARRHRVAAAGMAPLTGFNHQRMHVFADTTDENGTPIDARVIQVFQYDDQCTITDEEAREVAREVLGSSYSDNIPIITHSLEAGDCIVNTRPTAAGYEQFNDHRQMVRVSLSPIILEDGDYAGLDYDSGIFLDCLNVWALRQ